MCPSGCGESLTFSEYGSTLPVVAIAGRPNVGKSSLFNRFLGRRKAITDPAPGVTRDPVPAVWDLEGLKVLLVDTGGYKLDQEGLDVLVAQKSLETIAAADLVLLVLDVREFTPEDQALIEALRPWTDKIILAVNKVDTPEKENEVWSYHSLGFSRVMGISAAHGRNCGELEELIRETVLSLDRGSPGTAGHPGEGPEPDIRIALLGKPNTGKSTLLNRLTDRDLSIVSDIPGTTRDVVEGTFVSQKRSFRVLDTAGIRRKSKVEEDVEYYSVNRAIKTIEEADVVFLMIDAQEGLVDQDKKIASLVIRRGKGIILVLNKWDLMSKVGNQAQAVADRVRFVFPALDFAPLVPVSGMTGEGMDLLLKNCVNVWKQLNRRVETAKLNKALGEWTEYHPLPAVKGFQYKIRYITQVSANPLGFLAFVNRKKGFPETYVQFLRNQIRKDLGFSAVPFTLDLKQSGSQGG